jgi:hypothetical protein
MKKVLLIYLVLIVGIITWYYAVGKENRVFDNSKQAVMDNYYKMTNEFIKGDTLSINKSAARLKTALDSVQIDDLKADSAIYETAASIWEDTKTEINGMQSDPSLQAKKESLNLFSNELFTLLLTVRYDLSKLYWQECSSAFGDDTPGNWISEKEQSKNPYLEKDCATLKKVINFMPADSTKK